MNTSDKAEGKRRQALTASAAGACLLCAFTLGLDAHDRITTRVTWDREIAPIFEARCNECHRPGGRSTIALATYQQARPWAVAIKEEVLTRRMPKWYAARGYGDFANDPSLAPFEIALIAAWADGGAPERDKNTAIASSVAPTTKPAVFVPPGAAAIRAGSVPCGEQGVTGKLLAVRPTLEKNGSAGVTAVFPNGQQEVIGWIRDYDPDYATTYWLRRPLLLPRGSRIKIDGAGPCSLQLTFSR